MTETSHLRISKDLSSDFFWLVSKQGAEWESTYRSTPNAIEGSPTLFLRVYGEKMAQFFGYEFHDENTLQVPRSGFINAKIQELNQNLSMENQIALNFYETDSTPQSSEDYLRKFVASTSLPIADDGTVAIHDSTYHYGGIFIPDICLASAISQADLLLNFIDHLRAKDFSDEGVLEQLMFEMSLNIDSATGNFTAFLAQKEPPKNSAYWILSREGMNAEKYVKWFVGAALRKSHPHVEMTSHLDDFFLDSDNYGALHRMNLGPSAVVFEKIYRDKIAAIEKWAVQA